jgi:hypothetical protein
VYRTNEKQQAVNRLDGPRLLEEVDEGAQNFLNWKFFEAKMMELC